MWSKGTIIALFFCAGVLTSRAATEAATGKARLRELAGLPTVSVKFGYSINDLQRLASDDDVDDNTNKITAQIASLLKAMDSGSGDAARYHRLSELYWRLNEDEKATNAFNRSIALYRRQVESQPENAGLLVDFGNALVGSPTNRAEAEHFYRKATVLTSNDWRAWHGLADFLNGRALSVFADDSCDCPYNPMGAQPPRRPTTAQLAAANDDLAEAAKDYDRGVVCSPSNATVYINRAIGRDGAVMFQIALSRLRGDDSDASRWIFKLFGTDVEEDLKQVAKLDPRNYRAIALVAFCEMCTNGYRSLQAHPDAQSADGGLNSLPEESQKVVRDQLAALRRLEDDPDKHLVGSALESEGIILAIYEDKTGAEQAFRHALAADPAREIAAGGLVRSLVESKDFGGGLEICENLVKNLETTNTLLFLAKAQAYASHFGDAEISLKRILALAPDDPRAHLGLAGMLMKRPDDASMPEAADHIRHARVGLDNQAGGDDADELQTDYIFTAGLFQALIGNTEQARAAFRAILDHDPTCEKAKDALKALDN